MGMEVEKEKKEVEENDTDHLLEELGGCGSFQVIMIALLCLSNICVAFTFTVEQFGMHNPGWVCGDPMNESMIMTNMTPISSVSMMTTMAPNTSDGMMTTMAPNTSDGMTTTMVPNTTIVGTTNPVAEAGHGPDERCPEWSACKNVIYDSTTVTYISQWNLICGRQWILSTVLSVGQAGGFISNFFVGYIGDAFGRKYPFIIFRCLGFIFLSLVLMFSVSWQMFMVVKFFQGICLPYTFMWHVLCFEFVPQKWRIKFLSLPVWTLSMLAFAFVAWGLKNWKNMMIITISLAAVTAIPLFWIPESLRWLIVKGRTEEARKVIDRVAKRNKRHVESEKYVMRFVTEEKESQLKKATEKKYTWIDLFRKGYRFKTVAIGIIGFHMDLTQFLFMFSLVNIPGNVYMNMAMSSLTELPANAISYFIIPKLPRRITVIGIFMIESICVIAVVIIQLKVIDESTKALATLTLVLVTKSFMFINWIILQSATTEMYPTVVRSNIKYYMGFASALGMLIAPFAIPPDPSTFYVSYSAIAGLAVLSTFLSFFLPETKNKPVKDIFEEDEVQRKNSLAFKDV